ncbi:MAG: DNA repair protein RecN [Bacteroidales bacterium]|nr:DNA repair protein RecN [Bacteroidales bacterium]
MFKSLSINNYALIDRLDISVEPGFTVITGETGAGKSIMLGALGILLGGRAEARAVRTGAAKCVVEAAFDVSALGIQEFFEENDIDFDGEECILRREVTAAGKSRAFINDTPVPAARLKEIGALVIDIHSQHRNLLIGREDYLLDTLDTVAANSAEKAAYAEAYAQWRKAEEELKALRLQAEKGQTDGDYLKFQLTQIQEAALLPDEQEELEKENALLEHAEEIKASLGSAAFAINGSDGERLAELRRAAQQLESIAAHLPEAAALAERLESARIEIGDIADELERQSEGIDFNPARAEQVASRLNLIYDLLQKHRAASIADLLALAKDWEEQLNRLENMESLLEESQRRCAALLADLRKKGSVLTATRGKAANIVEQSLTESLHTLGMPNVSIRFSLQPREVPAACGMDTPVFLFSANKNVPMQPVSEIASGGEIARVMLALKGLIARHKNLPTIIFDEIDTGVSGTMAERMAVMMGEIAKHCQVLCITHLPQIAAKGNAHFRVHKEENETGTTSHISRLSPEERVREIATMLSGAEISEAAVSNAKTLLGMP